MPTLDHGKPARLDPLAHLPDRDDARRMKAARYRPEKPCTRHPDAAFYTCNDTCMTCWATKDRSA